jgi:catechol 2,3-dioxygenase-like lactoylglutathione lyase family enzyme
MLTHIDNLQILTGDLDSARRHCITLLGRSPSWEGRHPGIGMRNLIFRLSNTSIELLTPEGEGVLGDELRAHLARHGSGPYALGLGTDDIHVAVASMRERGLSPGDPENGLERDDPSGAFRKFRRAWLSRSETRDVGLYAIESLSDEELFPPSLPIGDEEAVVSRVDHAVIMTRDPEQAISFYGEQLGIRLALDRSFEKRGLRLLFFRLGGTTLEISASLREGADLGPTKPDSDLFWGIAYEVPNADRARDRLLEAGLEVSAVRDGHKPGTRVFSLAENSLGVPTLLIEKPSG